LIGSDPEASIEPVEFIEPFTEYLGNSRAQLVHFDIGNSETYTGSFIARGNRGTTLTTVTIKGT
jgi:hypothetical protein